LEVKKYFPLPVLLPKMFHFFEKLFELKIEENRDEFPTWHSEVRHFLVSDHQGDFIGSFYLDLHPREGKYNHAAAFSLIHGKETSPESYQAPISAMVCNFPRSQAGKPALLSHSDVETLFHEFGHILHGVLTRARFLDQSGTNVARDFVEAPSQVLENWVWQEESLRELSQHYETGESLPTALIERMKAAKKFGMALHMARQLSFAMTDMALHQQKDSKDPEAIYRKISEECFLPVPEDSQFLAGFGHLMGYDAGYYGYAWADVMAADLFAVFKEKGILDSHMGRRLREEIYESGSSREENTSLEKFLGRALSPDAFFQSLGVSA
jgi:thimet oligopeptidase